jgi:hypothetical protein
MSQSPTDIFLQSLPSLLPTDYIHRYLTEIFGIFTAHATITDSQSIDDYRWKYKQNYFVGKVLARKKILARLAVCKTVGVLFFLFPIELATKREITNDQYSDGRILSVKILPTNCMPYTDGMNPSIKLFNGVVFH